MKTKETLKQKAFRLWKKAGLPKFLNRYGPKRTPGWLVYLCHLEYTSHAPAWRRAAGFMTDYYGKTRHWTAWQKAISKWPQWVWDALGKASIDNSQESITAVDGTTLSRSNPSQHYLKRIGRIGSVARPIQSIILIDIPNRKFLSWRVRATPRGEKCDIPYLIRQSPHKPAGIIMDKGFDSNPLHTWLRDHGIWSIAPVRTGCKRGNYRRQLRDCFDWCLYWQRNIIESLISAVKRLFGSHVRARTARMQRAEVFSRFIAYNIGIKLTTGY